MGKSNFHHARISRRQFIAGAVAATSLLAAGDKSASPAAQDLDTATADQLLDAILDQQNTDLAVEALVQVLARSGIVVFDEMRVEPLVPASAPISPLAFERWQLVPFVDELASGGSRPAAVYDAMFPTQTEAGDAVPSFGEVLAGYYGGATTPGADFTRAYLDRFLSADISIVASDLPAPSAIVALLGGELLGQLQEATESARGSTMAGFAETAAFAPALSLAGGRGLAPMPLHNQTGACGVTQAFINDVINRISSVLKESEAVKGIPLIGEIVGAITKGVQLGIGLVIKAVDALLAPVLGVLRSIGAALAVASLIVGTLTPWSVSLNLRPPRNRFGIDAEVLSGEIDVIAGGWDRIPLPDVLRECATFAGIDLPKPTSEDAPVHVSVSQPLPLLSIDNPELRLDASGAATATYTTRNETSEEARGDEVISIAWITSVVEREDLKKLRDDLLAIFFRQLPDLVAQVVWPFVNATAADLTNKLIALAQVSTQQPLFITHHQPKDDPEESGTPDDPDDTTIGCFPGSFNLADPFVVQRMYIPFPMETTGTNTWEFSADGTVLISFNNLVLTMYPDPSAAFTSAFSGTQTGTYTDEGGVLSVQILENNAVVDTDMIALQGQVTGPTPMAGVLSGPYTCGNPIAWQVSLPEVGTVTYELVPAG